MTIEYVLVILCFCALVTGFACGYDYRDRHKDPKPKPKRLYIPKGGLDLDHPVDSGLERVSQHIYYNPVDHSYLWYDEITGNTFV